VVTGARLTIHPITLREARRFVMQHHRHHGPPQGALFAIGVADATGRVCGVVIVGRPVARYCADGWTAEVTRCCVVDAPHACSMLYAAAWRATRAMGYRRLITYTLAREAGTSLRAAGYRALYETAGGSWSRRSRPRVDTHPLEAKTLWEMAAVGSTAPAW
jgi:hypothetical protein